MTAGVDLYWIPLGAGGRCVRFNGRAFEALCAARDRRRPRDAVDGARRLTRDPDLARRVVDGIGGVPTPVWGRDEVHAGEMWNSNSVIAWLLATAGLPAWTLHPPGRGRAPGWGSGLELARRARPAAWSASAA